MVLKQAGVLAGRTDRKILAHLPGGDLVVLVKPQFEAGRAEASKGRGVIRDPEVRERAVAGVRSAMEEAGAAMMEVMESPLTGADGNVEFLAYFRAPSR